MNDKPALLGNQPVFAQKFQRGLHDRFCPRCGRKSVHGDVDVPDSKKRIAMYGEACIVDYQHIHLICCRALLRKEPYEGVRHVQVSVRV